MLKSIFSSIVATFTLGAILCGIYPVLVYGIGNILFHSRANGSFVENDGVVVGSGLIGQKFSRPEYLHGRPSAAGEGYDASNSSGTNLGPTNFKLKEALQKNIEAVVKENPNLKLGQIPTNLVTASASGLDPHLSPDAALIQVERIAKARNVELEQMQKILNSSIEGRQLGVLGEPVVNVLLFNLELDRKFPLGQSSKTVGKPPGKANDTKHSI